MKERPILFNAAMVRAILDGSQTQTRRPVRYQPGDEYPYPAFIVESNNPKHEGAFGWRDRRDHLARFGKVARCPYGRVGDRLWVKETWRTLERWNHLRPTAVPAERDREVVGDCRQPASQVVPVRFEADELERYKWDRDLRPNWGKTRVSIHMPRWASRLTLEVTDVRVQRVQEIRNEDAEAEGIVIGPFAEPWEAFAELWDSINTKRGFGWDSKCWVWAVSFKVLDGGRG